MDEDGLLAAWAAGDANAAAILIQRYSGDLLRFFRSKAAGDVEDLVQRTLLDCLEKRAERLDAASFRAYLFAIARNRLYSQFRATRAHGEVFDPDQMSLADLGTSPPSAIGRRAQERLLLEALRRLPLHQQILLELFYWENLSGPELASVFSIPEGTVRGRLRAAKGRLRQILENLEASPEVLHSTLSAVDDWAARLRDA